MGFINENGYKIPANNADVKYVRIDECRLSKPEKGAYFVLGYYADKQSALDGLEPILTTGKSYIHPHEFDTVFPNGQPYESNLYAYIATNVLADQGWNPDIETPVQ